MRKFFMAVLAAAFPFTAALAADEGDQTSGWAVLESEGGVRDVAVGGDHTCAVSEQGRVWCWGYNTRGQLGDGTTVRRLEPVRVSGLSGEFQAVATGFSHSCALSAAGAVWCWGYNLYGQLGVGTTASSLVPVALAGVMRTGVRAINAGAQFTCALSENGRAFCWGRNEYGQLGDGSTATRTLPVQVAGFGRDGRAISAGAYHACGLDRNGRAMCWGYNGQGRLGDGTTTSRRVATPVVAVPSTNIRMIAAGSRHSCLLTGPRRVFCWGNNSSGELGNGTTISSPVPIRVPRFRNGGAQHIAAGGASERNGFSCAINESGRTMCWGNNEYGQLGDGSTAQRLRPRLVLGLGGLVGTISLGSALHGCVTASQGRLLCWGYNWGGQLGDGSTSTSRAPVRVLGSLHTN